MKRSGSVKPDLVLLDTMLDHLTDEFVDDLACRALCVRM